MANIPKPLTSGHLCPACRGTGADINKTKLHRGDGYIRCHDCNGNGLDPAEYFNWMKPQPLNEIRVGLTLDGEVEAAFKYRNGKAVVDRRTGDIIRCDAFLTGDEQRWLIRRARDAITQ